jgi:hypothetical protein
MNRRKQADPACRLGQGNREEVCRDCSPLGVGCDARGAQWAGRRVHDTARRDGSAIEGADRGGPPINRSCGPNKTIRLDSPGTNLSARVSRSHGYLRRDGNPVELTGAAGKMAGNNRCHATTTTRTGRPLSESTGVGRNGLFCGDVIRDCIGRFRCLRRVATCFSTLRIQMSLPHAWMKPNGDSVSGPSGRGERV